MNYRTDLEAQKAWKNFYEDYPFIIYQFKKSKRWTYCSIDSPNGRILKKGGLLQDIKEERNILSNPNITINIAILVQSNRCAIRIFGKKV
jgi:hypothetical protein